MSFATADLRHTSVAAPRVQSTGGRAAFRTWMRRLTSLPALAALFALVTVLAAGPLSGLDDRLHQPWALLHAPQMLPTLHVLDHVAGQAVDLLILLTVAGVLAWRRRSWRPLLIAGGAELAFYGLVGGLKVLFARPAPLLHDPSFFGAGVFSDSWQGISYPSGHASEAVLIYGTVVYLLHRYGGASPRAVRWMRVAVAWIAVQAVAISYLLGYHWMTDLIGGVVIGGVALRLIVHVDQTRAVVPDPAVTDLRTCAEGHLRATWIGPMN